MIIFKSAVAYHRAAFALASSALLMVSAPSLSQPTQSSLDSLGYNAVLVPRPRGNGSSSGVKWANTPSPSQINQAMPFTASSAGRTKWLCAIQSDGHLTRCRLIASWPKGQGFATAAHSLLPYFQLSDRTVGDASLNGARVAFEVDVFNDVLPLGRIPGACPASICSQPTGARKHRR